MTHHLQELEDWQHHIWTEKEVRTIDARMRSLRRRLFWQRHKLEIIGLAALALGILAFGILMKVN